MYPMHLTNCTTQKIGFIPKK